MSQDCIFCKIIAGQIPSAKIYDQGGVYAFLDIAPVNKGHALVVPKKHYATLFDLPDDLGREMLAALKNVGRAVMTATGASGLNVGMNNYESAGQLVHHAHFHLIPRHDGDGLTLWTQHAYESTEEMRKLAQAIAAALG
ncbi:histidine triad (HIT) family protein [Humidesulfovibrio mexicanus]|uniref:Histidine triad (HIT) family protein n=1 Tax=Humidesulfovibrio mexicanus TaxID=147047 RepID=A0A239CTM8_9BACT|nr:HIT family protein [Humidesulfovibrio mexicanus]SNS23011.1 histidine triad (HIT) family protein [Humidesulfovibrio mexicanus]